jgi:hypothetical protein
VGNPGSGQTWENTPTGGQILAGGVLVTGVVGSHCDGATDDTANFQAAINGLASTGGTLIIPGCANGNPYRAAGIILASNVNIKGTGEATIKLLDNVCNATPTQCVATPLSSNLCNGNIFSNIPHWNSSETGTGPYTNTNLPLGSRTYLIQNVEISELVLDGNKANNTAGDNGNDCSWAGAGINIDAGVNIHIHDITSRNMRLDGVMFGLTPQGGTDNSELDHGYFTGNIRRDLSFTSGIGDIIHDNQMLSGLGIDMEPNQDGEYLDQNIVRHNFILGIISAGSVHAPLMDHNLYEGNQVTSINSYGIGIFTDMGQDSKVIGNVIQGNRGTGSTAGIYLYSATGPNSDPVTIENNTITGFGACIGQGANNGSVGRFIARGNTLSNCFWGIGALRAGNSIIDNNNLFNIGSTTVRSAFFEVFNGQGTTYQNQGRIVITNNRGVDGILPLTTFLEEDAGSGEDTDLLPGPYVTFQGNQLWSSLSSSSSNCYAPATPCGFFMNWAGDVIQNNLLVCLNGSPCAGYGSPAGYTPAYWTFQANTWTNWTASGADNTGAASLAVSFTAVSGTKIIERCSGGTLDGSYVAAGSTQATSCTTGSGTLINTGFVTK